MQTLDRAIRAWDIDFQDADGDLVDLDLHRAMGYQLAKENPIAIGALNTDVTQVIGTGLKLQCSVDREYLERRFGLTTDDLDKWELSQESRFAGWAESLDCDLERQQNFYDLQALMVRTERTAGDAIALMPFVRRRNSPYGLRIQPIDPARLRNKNDVPASKQLAGGVRRDRRGAVVAYQFMNSHPHSRKIDGIDYSWTEISAFGRQSGRRNVIHLFDKSTAGVSASRGRPPFAPLVKTLKQLGRYTDAELMAAVIQSFFTVFIKTEDGMGLSHGEAGNAEQSQFADPGEVALGMGNVVDLAANEDIEMAKAERPNSGFDAFMKAMLQQIGMVLNIPYEVLVQQFQTSYTAARAAILLYWKGVQMRRQHAGTHFCQVVYENHLAESIAIGETEAPGFFTDPLARRAWCRAFWIGPPRGMIDPNKEVSAELDLIDHRLKSRSASSLELFGQDWDPTFHRIVREERMLESAKLQSQTGSRSAELSLPSNNQPGSPEEE